ncbi:spondin-1-like isoform X4 [Clavelina lepadiformis]|uniref:spondin-1-like isoform X4 n=1 Tax=Clavelina lepadiformis TaxID=159417 RepID=UPI004042ADDC
MDDCEQCVPCGCCLFLVVVVLMGAFYTANKTPPSRLSIDDNDHFREVRQPVDCQVDYWGSWTSCSATCGIGTHQRNRGIIRYASYGGSSCPATWESKKCELRPCPRNCQVNDWTSWSDCSKSCGTGTRQRSREVIQQNDYNGKGCLELDEEIECNDRECPVHCEVGQWSNWSDCSTSCGLGSRHRTRLVIKENKYDGNECPSLKETADCNTGECPVNCLVGDWTTWNECSKSCGTGTRQRSREVIQQNDYNGKDCPELDEEIECNERECPVHCEVGDWTTWNECSKSCGTGTRQRSREVIQQNDYNGKDCPELDEEIECIERECPVHCEVGQWSNWSDCSTSCGLGSRHRTRRVIRENEYDGNECPSLKETANCNAGECPVNCLTGPWKAWEECTVSCGGGKRARYRDVIKKADYNGKACVPVYYEDCNEEDCPKPTYKWIFIIVGLGICVGVCRYDQCIYGRSLREKRITLWITLKRFWSNLSNYCLKLYIYLSTKNKGKGYRLIKKPA